ncbi:rhombosortase [Neptuniibacter sp. 2_MG-2023]|uniref:rhombosortase n=1 Tax=Neptuniibacter sp. 2_MG-2023 TaxID=3062671 RepID=UPI0026E31292|nr:rhombosortase [Neptuniibacter sp. 2_MG-2023]MDO6514332.1 rhombosortase [Neptuniibacter sp. 2_MG-2023]
MRSLFNDTFTASPRGGLSPHKGSTPYVTLIACAIMLILGVLPNSLVGLHSLSFDYVAIIEQQQYWRLITGHLIHSSWNHLLWDLTTFTVAAFYLEKQSPKLLIYGIVVSATALDLYLLSPLSSLESYAGISGVLYTVITLAALFWYKKEPSLLGLVPLLMILIKTIVELTAQNALFVTEGWSLYPPAHLIGAAIGIALWCLYRRNRSAK